VPTPEIVTLLTQLGQIVPGIEANIVTALLFKFGGKLARPLVKRIREELSATSGADLWKQLEAVEAGTVEPNDLAALNGEIARLMAQSQSFQADIAALLSEIIAASGEARELMEQTLAGMKTHDDVTRADHDKQTVLLENILARLATLAAQSPVVAVGNAFPEPVTLYGRPDETNRLKDLLSCHQPRVIQLIGQSGVGKTALAARVVHDLKLDYVRVEMHGESAEAVTNRLFEILIGQQAPQRPHAELVAAIVDAWQKRKCLLVLDNLHSLLTPEAVPKDDAAKLLLEKLGEHGQLLTLGWPGTDALGTSNEHVLTWPLEGIKETPGVAKMRAEGVSGEPKTISLEKVVETLDGNPKMLEILATLIRKYGGQATILDQYPDWVSGSMAPLRAVWDAIGKELQELVAALCVFRRGRNAMRLGAFLNRKNVQPQLESLMAWRLVRPLDGVQDYGPDHDLVRKVVGEHFGEEKLHKLHGRAIAIWSRDTGNIGKEKTPTTLEEIRPLLEAGYHLAQRKDGDALLELIWSKRGGQTLDELAGMFGAWTDIMELWAAASLYASDERNRAAARQNMGIYMQRRGDWERALAEYRACLAIMEKLGDFAGVANSRGQIGRVYHDQREWEKALSEYRASLEIAEKIRYVAGVAKSRHNIGVVYQDGGKWEEALAEYRASLEIAEKLGDVAGVAKSRHEIGMVYQALGEWERALSEYRASLEIAEKLGDVAGAAKSRHEIGRVYQKQGEWEKALTEYRTSLEIAEKIGDKRGVAETHGQMGLLYKEIKGYAEALPHSLMALSVFAQIGDPRVKIVVGHLVLLHRAWGSENFDTAWKEQTGEEVPEWVKGETEGMREDR
jgi:tetratricopeptide (TPR) repeat protein